MSHRVEVEIKIMNKDELVEIMKKLGFVLTDNKTMVSFYRSDNKEVDFTFYPQESTSGRYFPDTLNIGVTKNKDGSYSLCGDDMLLDSKLKEDITKQYTLNCMHKCLGFKGYSVVDNPKYKHISASRFVNGKQQTIEVGYGKNPGIETSGFTGGTCCTETTQIEKMLGMDNAKKEFKSEFFSGVYNKQKLRCSHNGLCG